MSFDKDADQCADDLSEELEIDEFVPHERPVHHDQHGHYTHELPEGGADAASRALVRFVPLVFGGLFGSLADNVVLGLVTGVTASAAFDLYMGENSIIRGLSRRVLRMACPGIAAAAHGTAGIFKLLGLAPPAALGNVQCGVSEP